jgi:AraC family transcriptional regulator of adaptative response/methylated-DNA-[protein]-cysteine methyltransferase
MRQLPPQSDPSYGFAETPFGECCIAFSNEGVFALIFPENKEAAYSDLDYRFPDTDFRLNNEKASLLIQQIFEDGETPKLYPIGTDFQQSVWSALQQVPIGKTTTYAHIAECIGRPKAVRAVGTAIGANPIALLIPCHRVIRTDGSLGGFRWGLECKKKILQWESEA